MFCPTQAWSQSILLTRVTPPWLLHSPLHPPLALSVDSPHLFVGLHPPHSLRSPQFHFGWTRVGLICDKMDGYSSSFFNILNGTDPTNVNNLQPPANPAGVAAGPYDTPRLEIAHAQRIDIGQDNNATKDALIATIKAKDIKVIVLLGQTVFVDGILTYGIDRGVFTAGSGFQFIVTSAIYPDTMSSRSRAALDGMLTTTAAGIFPEYPGMQRSST